MNSREEQLRAIFSSAGWARFITQLTGYRDRAKPFPTKIMLRDPTDEERRHYARLLRTPISNSAEALHCYLGKISAALAATGLPDDWHDVLAILRGPIPNDTLTAQATRQAWRDFWPRTVEELALDPFPMYQEWCESLKGDGSLKRLCKGDPEEGRRWIRDAAHLLRTLPLKDESPLAHVAAAYCKNSHALDPIFPLSTLVLRGLALRQGQPAPSRSDERRDLWAAFGVICDELSAPVLTFNLGLTGDALICHLVAMASAASQPIHLTSRMFWAADWSQISSPPNIFVCENPTIVSLAANQLGRRCPPLICVNGEPRHAARLLLHRLRKAGTTLWYHGDFDWPGIAIADRIFTDFGAMPWCFDADSYTKVSTRPSRPLHGTPLPTPWSPELSATMTRIGHAYDEELLADVLFEDLERRLAQDRSMR